MIVAPLGPRRPKAKPVALIAAASAGGLIVGTEAHGIRSVRGRARCSAALRELAGWEVYSAGALIPVLHSTGARSWSGRTWHGALTNIKLDEGPKITPLRKALASESPEEALESLLTALEWLGHLSVRPGSLSSMAWQLWRASLPAPVKIAGPPIRPALYGGRQEAPWPGEYRAIDYLDLGAAYPSSMAAEPYPLRLVEVAPSTDYRLGAGIAAARVRLPRLQWGPLPVRVATDAVCYGWGTAVGYWPWRELALAREAGADVEVVRSWAPMAEADLFGPWWEMAEGGRRLPGGAGAIAKAVTSSLWGQFALDSGHARRVRWSDDWAREAVSVPEPARTMPHRRMVHIAADTTSRVRCRLWREGLTLAGAIYCDTDAVIASAGARPDAFAARPGSWSLKNGTITNIDIRGPQVYRHGCPTCSDDHPPWHYCVSGASSREMAERIFRRQHAKNSTIAIGRAGLSLPNMDLDRAREMLSPTRERERKKANAIAPREHAGTTRRVIRWTRPD